MGVGGTKVLVDTHAWDGTVERHRKSPRTPVRRRRARLAAMIAAVGIATVIIAARGIQHAGIRHKRASCAATPTSSYHSRLIHRAVRAWMPLTHMRRSRRLPTATGVKPNVVVYYSGWMEPFQAGFATTVAHDGAVPLVQINPTGISVAAIAAGQYDTYLNAYAKAVRAYHHPVILSFGHEMNGHWYSWGYTHTSPTVFVAAWRHIVTLFRARKPRT